MATKKFKFAKDVTKGKDTPKKGRINNTRTILTSAGVVTLGSAAAAYMAGYNKGKDKADDQPQTAKADEDNLVNTPANDQNINNNPVHTHSANTAPNGNQPEDTTHVNSQNQATQTTQNTPTDPTPEKPSANQPVNPEPNPESVDPEEVAKNIIQENLIDPEDLEPPTMISSVENISVMYMPDGREIKVAEIETFDGAHYLLADTDGDGFYTDVLDTNGIFLGKAEGQLVFSDLEAMHDQSHGYLAVNPDEPEPVGDDPTADILDTDHPLVAKPENSVADNKTPTEQPTNPAEDLTEEELLALLLADVQETSGTGVVEINTSTQPDPDEPIETVYGPATDPIDDIPEDVVDTDDDGPDYYDEDVDDSAGASFDEDTI